MKGIYPFTIAIQSNRVVPKKKVIMVISNLMSFLERLDNPFLTEGAIMSIVVLVMVDNCNHAEPSKLLFEREMAVFAGVIIIPLLYKLKQVFL